MNRLFAFTVAVAMALLQSQAAVVSPQEALDRASADIADSHANAKSNAPMLNGISSRLSALRLMRTIDGGDQLPAVYVFADAANTAMFVSADDCAPALLGYSDAVSDGGLTVPDALEYMLECYAGEIAALRGAAAYAVERPYRASISPIIKTQWDQTYPYNLLTPNGSPTGCTITAMAQLCRYYQWPLSMEGEGSATNQVTGGTATMDLSQYGEFKYDLMEASYVGDTTDEAQQAVSELMVTLGFAFGASYKNGATSASTATATLVMVNNGYNPGTRWVTRETNTLLDWETMIYDDLVAGHPVAYTGYNAAGKGHAFIVDGYSQDGYYHINWGWGGLSDGYFLLNILDPSSQGTGSNSGRYDINQACAIGLYPTEAENDLYYALQYSTNFSFGGEQFAATNDVYAIPAINSTRRIRNLTVGAHKWYIGLEATSVDDPTLTADFYTTSSFSSTAPGKLSSTTTSRNVDVTGLADGKYTLRPIWKNADGERLYVLIPLSQCQRQLMTIADGVCTIGDPEEERRLPYVSDMQITTGQIILGSRSTSSGTVVNDTDAEFYGYVMGCLLDRDGNVADRVAESQVMLLNVPAHTSIDYTLSSVFEGLEQAGDYDFAWCVQPYAGYDAVDEYAVISNKVAVSMTLDRPETLAEIADLCFVQDAEVTYDAATRTFTGVDHTRFCMKFTITCTQGFFDYPVYLWPYDTANYNLVANSFETDGNVMLAAGESMEVTFEGDYGALTAGHTYSFQLYGASYDSSTKSYDYFYLGDEYYFTVAGEYAERLEDLELQSLAFTTGTYKAASHKFANVDPSDVELEFTVKANNNCTYTLYMWPLNDSDDDFAPEYLSGRSTYFKAGETVTYTLSGKWSKMDPEETYWIYLYGYAADGSFLSLSAYEYCFTVKDSSGISDTMADREPVSTEYYNLHGQRVANPSQGLYIQQTRYSDGSTSSIKSVAR